MSRQDSRSAEFSLDVAFDILNNRRRRQVLQYLQEQDGPVEVGALAERIAAWENDTTMSSISSNVRKSVYTALYQTHLPKLADASIVDYDRNRGTVELGQNAELIDQFLRDARETDSTWSHYYLALSAIGGLVVSAQWFGPLSTAPEPAIAGVLIALFTALTIVYAVAMDARVFGSAGPGGVSGPEPQQANPRARR